MDDEEEGEDAYAPDATADAPDDMEDEAPVAICSELEQCYRAIFGIWAWRTWRTAGWEAWVRFKRAHLTPEWHIRTLAEFRDHCDDVKRLFQSDNFLAERRAATEQAVGGRDADDADDAGVVSDEDAERGLTRLQAAIERQGEEVFRGAIREIVFVHQERGAYDGAALSRAILGYITGCGTTAPVLQRTMCVTTPGMRPRTAARLPDLLRQLKASA
jgi:hypothetical protein